MGINKIKYLGRKFFGVRNLSTTPTYDPDAQAYFNVNAAITSAADKNAINTFYLGLKTDGIYTKLKAMYLPIWGSAATCKWNLINPLDTNAAFRCTYATGMTFSSNGMKGNGTSAYANTFLSSDQMSLNSLHLSYYSQQNLSNAGATEIGSLKSSPNSYSNLIIRQDINTANMRLNSGGVTTNITNTNAIGFYCCTRRSVTDTELYKNGISIQALSTNSFAVSNIPFFINAYNFSVIAGYSTKESSFVSIGSGLTATEVLNLSTRINTLMTYFGINKY